MAEDLLDYWVRLIKTILPANALIHSRFSNNDYLIQIAWMFQDESEISKRSKKIEVVIKERIIEAYLDKNKKDRELSDVILKDFICKQYNHLISDNAFQTNQHASTIRVVNL
jgi:hypothetical protein